MYSWVWHSMPGVKRSISRTGSARLGASSASSSMSRQLSTTTVTPLLGGQGQLLAALVVAVQHDPLGRHATRPGP
jgi:hypothetical protein